MTSIDVQDGVHIAVSWKDQSAGSGPYASFYVRHEEILRFDCFGPGCGHFHVYPRRYQDEVDDPWRREFSEDAVDLQIERAIEELLVNAQRYVDGSSGPDVRAVRLDQRRLTDASKEMRRYMQQYHHANRRLSLAGRPA
jgi:hypothetical protein